MLTGSKIEVLNLFAVVFTLGEMLFLCAFIISLVIFSVRHKHGKKVPAWVPSLVVSN